MFTLFIFLIVIAILVLSHEFGHFIVAKWKGMRVDEFGFGFPPRIYGRQIGETFYSINALPFGGFVRVWGEDDGAGVTDTRNFAARSAKDRFLVLVAGVGMNFILAYLIFTVLLGIGLPLPGEITAALFPDAKRTVHVGGVVPDSPAAHAGIVAGDAIENITVQGGGTVAVSSIREIQDIIAIRGGEEVRLHVARAGALLEISVVPEDEIVADGKAAIGVSLVEESFIDVPFWRAPWEGARMTFMMASETVRGLAIVFGNLFTGNIELARDSVAGPVGIAVIAGETARAGFVQTILLVAFLSLALGVLNLLPIPALDGGRIFFLLIEKIRGAPVPLHISQYAHMIGFITLIVLMLLVTYIDISRIF